MEPTQTVCVVGLGYIGLPTAAILAANGNEVIGVDVNPRHVDEINAGRVPFIEPDLESVVAGVVAQGRLKAQAEVPHANSYIVAVPTPFTDDYDVDPKYVQAAAEAIAPQLRGGELIILESTSPPGLTERMGEYILAARPDLTGAPNEHNSIYFAHCPERVLPGRIMIEIVDNDRIIGGVTEEAAERARHLYATFCKGQLLVTDARTAEMAKLVENSYRDVNIAFANELSVISDRLGIDVWKLIELANHHPRVNILQPGPGVGGHCIAVDPWFIVAAAPEEAKLVRLAREVNDAKPDFVLEKVMAKAAKFREPVIAALGIAFKADIDDLRESPSKAIVERLSAEVEHAKLLVVEPNVEELPASLADRPNVELAEVREAVSRADIVVVLVDHHEFKTLDREILAEKIVVDTKGLWR
ncbi:UDP-N-acetyl-D-mannosamine dehydrogenase [Agrococcus sp. BE272]|uniref:UDP-N-acetyl-D-mannosamine dehydrogenase n=1 Tax=Agrococcus sp. BE272 TaxID=2817727 RepID=UPI0028604168|nr:UDP-N-acetyl-D-mannosamine dehydrogenase [Agrococcus sp. BE272]MDR7233173.1 UDP-N-acetyl-D-mannosaminuronic acid dehydrogenase [Agrococcus sp. BE272]